MSKILPSADNTDVLGQSQTSSLTSGSSSDLRWNAVLNNVDVEGALLVKGGLTVQGTTTTVSTTNTVISDKLLELANGDSGTPSGDRGIIIERGDEANAAFIWDESADQFTIGTTTATAL